MPNRGQWLEVYAIAWTLGRWRVGAALPTLEKLRPPTYFPTRLSDTNANDQLVRRSVLLTKATCVPSGDHEGTLIVPWPPYT